MLVDRHRIATQPKPSLIEGRFMLCPKCEMLRDPMKPTDFKRLDIATKYEHELNVIYQCVKSTGGCGHYFSPGSPEIMQAYLDGGLVPAPLQNEEGE